MTVLVPVIGWLLVLNESFARFLAAYFKYDDFKSLSWQVYSLHVGLSIFGICILATILFCPEPIKSHDNPDDYREKKLQTLTRYEIDRMFQTLSSEVQKACAPKHAGGLTEPKGIEDLELWVRRNKEHVFDVMLNTYDRKNESWPALRWAISVLFVVSGAMVFAPTITTIWKSVATLLRLLKIL